MIKKSDLTPESRKITCLCCENEYSACISDYFWMEEEDTFTCECGSDDFILE